MSRASREPSREALGPALAASMVTRDIRLSNGTLCIHRPLANGAQEVIAVGKERGAFSKAEHEEYRALAAALPHRDMLYVRRPYLEDPWYPQEPT